MRIQSVANGGTINYVYANECFKHSVLLTYSSNDFKYIGYNNNSKLQKSMYSDKCYIM